LSDSDGRAQVPAPGWQLTIPFEDSNQSAHTDHGAILSERPSSFLFMVRNRFAEKKRDLTTED